MLREILRFIMKQSFARLAASAAFSMALAGAVAADKSPAIDYDNLPLAEEPEYEGQFRPIGSVIRLAPEMDELVDEDAQIELLATGFEWAEGPVWSWRKHALIFSDVPENRIYEWKQGKGLNVYMDPSGYTGAKPREGGKGSNGLTLDAQGRLVICQHGDRRISMVNADGSLGAATQYYQWRRYNSPNDLVFHSNGDLYFTDPSYGLASEDDRELPYNGVYRLGTKGKVTLLESELTYPNGIALSPDESVLYVAVSDPNHPHIMAYDVREDGTLNLKTKRVFFDALPLKQAGGQGSTDGLKVDVDGNVWSTGPGGVLVISPEGQHYGTISPGPATANCAWGNDGSVLYMTSDMYLCRINTKTMGVGPGFGN